MITQSCASGAEEEDENMEYWCTMSKQAAATTARARTLGQSRG
jgi:hypothetical protein